MTIRPMQKAYVKDNGVVLLYQPYHDSHNSQLLDRGILKPLKIY